MSAERGAEPLQPVDRGGQALATPTPRDLPLGPSWSARLASQVVARGPQRAELVAAVWEMFSAALFASAVAPVAIASPWPCALFILTLATSAAGLRFVVAGGERAIFIASAVRILFWCLAVSSIPNREDPRLWIATLTFGLMAAAMRRAIYRRELLSVPTAPDSTVTKELGPALARWLRGRLGESAAMAGILGGHLVLLFGVAFLRAQSELLFRGWSQMIPLLAVSATLVYTIAMLLLTRETAAKLRRGETFDDDASIAAVRALPNRLAALNFVMWVGCTAAGVFYFKSGPDTWRETDALTQLGYAALFSWGIAYYQRGWDRDSVAELARVASRPLSPPAASETKHEATYEIRERMLRDFGWPLVFAAVLMLFSSINLYRTLGGSTEVKGSEAAVLALVAAVFMLVLAVGGVIARVARELSSPIVRVSEAAETVASGKLDASVPYVEGPAEISRLAQNVERMREHLARTIGEVESERANLETKVEERTRELQKALRELREAQAALVKGERLASIGELVAGVAHEINNPLNAVAGSAEPLEQVVTDVRRMLDAYRAAERELPQARRKELEAMRAELDLDASLDDLVGISTVVKRATDRTVRIVQNLKNFARSTQEAVPADLQANLEETLVLLAPRIRQSCIQVVKAYDDLPQVVCRPGEMNQVFMNLLMNAIQALEGMPAEASDAEAPKEIRVETAVEKDSISIAICDNGPGVPEGLASKIFDPFFTTKPRGQGTGLGLSISTDIVRKHGGSLDVEAPRKRSGSLTREAEGDEHRTSEKGARFVVRLPLRPEKP